MGHVFFDLGMLSVVEVVDCSASDLIGSYVGQTGPKTRAQLEKALGKVLFIDEAYRLAEGNFATEAINELVDLLTKPRFKGKLLVVLAGYDKDINNLISVNPGLSSRFPEQIVFRNMKIEHCVELLERSVREHGIEFPRLTDPQTQVNKQLTLLFEQMAGLSSWGNARDVNTLASNIIGSVFKGKISKSESLSTTGDNIIRFTEAMLQERRERISNIPASSIGNELAKLSLEKSQLPDIVKPTTTLASPSERAATPEPSPPPLFSPDTEESHRDKGVSDEIWTQLQADIQAANSQIKISTDDIEKKEKELSAAVVNEQEKATERQKSEETKAKNKADEQERKRKQEAARVQEDLARRAREQAKAELERLRLAKAKQRREEQVQVRLRQMGVCCMGYQWIKQASGYRCAGGSHFVSNEQVGL